MDPTFRPLVQSSNCRDRPIVLKPNVGVGGGSGLGPNGLGGSVAPPSWCHRAASWSYVNPFGAAPRALNHSSENWTVTSGSDALSPAGVRFTRRPHVSSW